LKGENVKLMFVVVLLSAVLVHAQDETPEILSVSQVVAGAQRTETRYAIAVGKWSDPDDHLAVCPLKFTAMSVLAFAKKPLLFTQVLDKLGRLSIVGTFSAGTIGN
jgi:hypothetical protein